MLGLLLVHGCRPPLAEEPVGSTPADDSAGETGGDTGGDTPRRTLVATPVDPLPQRADAAVLLAQLHADGTISVEGTVRSELYVDLDGAEDDRYGFRYQLLDASGALLYERTTSGPLIVRDFLAYYGGLAGYDLLTVLPALGGFPVTVPLLADAATVNLQLRDDAGEYVTVGDYDLARLDADDEGVSDAVVGEETLWDSGPPDNRLDLVLVGDGYTAEEQEQWHADAEELAAAILSIEPLASFADAVNIHRVDVVSNESGVSFDCDGCGFRDTALQTLFPLEAANAFLGTDYRTSAIFQLDQHEVARVVSVVPWDFVVVVANTEHDGGFAVHYATVAKGSDHWAATGVHELGHALGLLGDEYDVDDCIRSDALGLPDNITDDPTNPPWQAWIDADTPLPTPDTDEWDGAVGAFSPAYNCGDLYRPARSCRMFHSSGGDFCPVCGELLTRRVFRYADPADDVSVTAADDGALLFTVDGLRADAGVEWALDGVALDGGGATRVLAPSDVPKGTHTLTARATVVTDRVRSDGGDLTEAWSFEVR